MTLGNLIQISASGAEDRYLYGNPQVTYFKDVYKRSTNFAINYSKVPLNGTSSMQFGSEVKVRIPISGDLLGAVFIKIHFSDLVRNNEFSYMGASDRETDNIPRYTSYVNGIGYNCIEHVKLMMNGQNIQTLDGKLIYLYNELYNSQEQKRSFYRSTGFFDDGFIIGTTNTSDVKCNVMLPLFFSKNSSTYLPLCALTKSVIELHIKFKPLNKCLVRKYQNVEFPTTEFNALFTDGTTMRIDADRDDFILDFLNELPQTIDFESVDGLGTEPLGQLRNPGQGSITRSDYIDQLKSNYPVPVTGSIMNEDVSGSIENLEIITENIFLDQNERSLFMNKELSYLVELFSIGNEEIIENPSSNNKYHMEIISKHPTKYIFWYTQRKDCLENNLYEDHSYRNSLKFDNEIIAAYNHHILDNSAIIVNNNELINNVDSIFLSNVQLQYRFQTSSNSIIYMYSFALNPKSVEPSGTLNFSKVQHKRIRIELGSEANITNNLFPEDTDEISGNFYNQTTTTNRTSQKQDIIFKYYSCYYNILLIRDGLSSLLYS